MDRHSRHPLIIPREETHELERDYPHAHQHHPPDSARWKAILLLTLLLILIFGKNRRAMSVIWILVINFLFLEDRAVDHINNNINPNPDDGDARVWDVDWGDNEDIADWDEDLDEEWDAHIAHLRAENERTEQLLHDIDDAWGQIVQRHGQLLRDIDDVWAAQARDLQGQARRAIARFLRMFVFRGFPVL